MPQKTHALTAAGAASAAQYCLGDSENDVMKKSVYLLLPAILLSCISLWAQTPVPDPDTIANPIKEGDPALRTLPPRLDYVEHRKRIQPEELPQQVRETLQSGIEYDDWKNAEIYFDKNKEEYIVEFSEAAEKRSYRFNREGKPILEK